tara:strand:- start:90 stop:260 length:171 start_codon:yes stop_codon:yes gene_type:complete
MLFAYFVDGMRPLRSAFVKQFPSSYGVWQVGSSAYRDGVPLEDGARGDNTMVIDNY